MLSKIYLFLRRFKTFLQEEYLLFLLKKQSIDGDFVIVTGADSSHFKSAKQFLESVLKFDKKSNVIFYNLGLTTEEAVELKNEFTDVIFETFDYSQFPDFFDIKTNAGEYAWKPVIIWETLRKYKCKVIWMDAGNLVLGELENLKKYICMNGYFWHYSPGKIEDWTHEQTLSYLDVPPKLYSFQNISAAAIGFDYENQTIRELAFEWKKCAMRKECIAPEGSDRSNHRQDQAVLTILAHKKGLARGIKLRKTGFLIQQDID